MAHCRTCGNDAATAVHTRSLSVTKWEPHDSCDKCGGVKVGGVPDVAYPYGSGTHTEENIAYPHGHPQAGEPIPFSSRQQKAEAMRIAGVREAGDRKHGSLNFNKGKKTYFT